MENRLKLFFLYQNKYDGYDTYDSCVVVANSLDEAKLIHPASYITGDWSNDRETCKYSGWCTPEDVKGRELGIVTDNKLKVGKVVCSSFNAG